MYSSHTSLSYSPSLSEGAATPNSKIHHDTEQNLLNDNNNALVENSNFTKKHKNNTSLCTDKQIDVKSATVQKTMKSTGKITDGEGNNKLLSLKTNPNATSLKSNGKSASKLTSNAANGEGSYHCQFCDKTFPRLGYLKKHEQVYHFNVSYIEFKFFSYPVCFK